MKYRQQVIDALRSGQYRQGIEFLRLNDASGQRHSLLGVMTDLAVKAGVAEWQAKDEGFDIAMDLEGQVGTPFEPPPGVLEYYELDDMDLTRLAEDNYFRPFEHMVERLECL